MNIRFALLSALLVLAFAAGSTLPSQAYAPEVETMEVMGFSPDTIDMTMTARSRAEWRGTRSRKRSFKEQLLYNFVHNVWIDPVDEAGHSIIRRH